MKMSGVFNFEEGRDKIIELVNCVKRKPVLVGIYGWPNSGKSYLIKEIGNYFNKKSLPSYCYGGSTYVGLFEQLRDDHQLKHSLHLFHSAWERFYDISGKVVSFEQDPGWLAENILGRDIDLKVGIYNPFLYGKIYGEYDFVISNPSSVKKPVLY